MEVEVPCRLPGGARIQWVSADTTEAADECVAEPKQGSWKSRRRPACATTLDSQG